MSDDPFPAIMSHLRDNLCTAVAKELETKEPDFFNKYAINGILPTWSEKLDIVLEILTEKAETVYEIIAELGRHDTGEHP